MYEVELKAHVTDRKKTICLLSEFAHFCGGVKKEDCYYGITRGEKKTEARIRKEIPLKTEETDSLENAAVKNTGYKNEHTKEEFVFTYKQKELRHAEKTPDTQNSDIPLIEVNTEKECVLSDAEPLSCFLLDAGFNITLRKTKTTISWRFEDAHIELCTVPPLGDFLEIEIISPREDEKEIQRIRKKITSIFKKCGIIEEMIEEKYYSELLREYNENQQI